MKLTRRALLGSAAATLLAAPRRKIVFIADQPSHGFGEHECNAGCLLLAKCLGEQYPGLDTVVHRNGWPGQPRPLEGASGVVLFTNGSPQHPAVPHLDEMEPVMRAGAGLAVFHWGLGVDKGAQGQKFLDWIGGYYETFWSVNPMWTAQFKEIPRHPVSRGVKPFSIYDEWYYHMRFREDMNGVTPILTAVPPDGTRERPFGAHSGNQTVRARKGMPEHVAWAYQRPAGGRGFGFSGGHYHWAWSHDDYRKLVLNGIAWTAGLEIPANGVSSKTPTYEDLLANLDKPKPYNFTQEDAEKAIKPR